MNPIKRLLPDSFVEKMYAGAGETFGEALSYSFMGKCLGFKGLLNKLVSWEEEYAHRGYRTVSLDRFADLGGHGIPIDDVLGQKCAQEEKPILHALTYKCRLENK